MQLVRGSGVVLLISSVLPCVSGYNQSLGISLAYIEKAVYCGKELFESWDVGRSVELAPPVDVSKLRWVTNADTQAAAGVGRMLAPNGCFVSIRGTHGDISSLLDASFWWTSFGRASCPGCQVDWGFKKSYESIKSDIFSSLEDFGCKEVPLYLVGHSQGAASLHYLLYDLIDEGYKVAVMYALESPRPGNEMFAKALRDQAKETDAYRVAHYKDIVVHLPPKVVFDNKHALQEVYYPQRVGTDYRICGVEDDKCSNQWWLWQLTAQDHMWYADLNPCRCSKETTEGEVVVV